MATSGLQRVCGDRLTWSTPARQAWVELKSRPKAFRCVSTCIDVRYVHQLRQGTSSISQTARFFRSCAGSRRPNSPLVCKASSNSGDASTRRTILSSTVTATALGLLSPLITPPQPSAADEFGESSSSQPDTTITHKVFCPMQLFNCISK